VVGQVGQSRESAALTSALSATSRWRVMAPMTMALPSRLMPTSSVMPAKSASGAGLRQAQLHGSQHGLPAGQHLGAASGQSQPLPARWRDALRVNAYMVWFFELWR